MREADSLQTYLHTLGSMSGYDHFVFDEETASVHLSRYDPATKFLHSGSLQAGLERSEVANRRTVKVNALRATADCVRLSFRLYCCESVFLSKEVECFLENRGPYYGQTHHVFVNGTVHSRVQNAVLLGKSSINTHIHEVIEIVASEIGYSVLRIRSFCGADVVSVKPEIDEAFLDAYHEWPSLLTLLMRNDGLWIRRHRWRGTEDLSTEEVIRLGEHDVHAIYTSCATGRYIAVVSRTLETNALGYVAMNLQVKVYHRDSGKAFEVCQSILADSERLQLGCGSDTLDVFTVKNGQIHHLVVLLPTTFHRSLVSIPSLCHCGLCSCGRSRYRYSYPKHPYNDTGANPYDAPDACKGFWSYEPPALDNDDETADAAKKWTAKQSTKPYWARRIIKPGLGAKPSHSFPLSVIVL